MTPAPADRLFSAAYVLLGAGIVGGLFGIFSGDVMDYQVRYAAVISFTYLVNTSDAKILGGDDEETSDSRSR